ncbi:hypothetical protein SCUCBS95973_007600 [Sporothrix curviconia]|uniref:Phosphatidylinositol-specific phospholipase C X domain-containing protein n=1 Tax=Sporothrix curviconia TaxID=1260050 RepID=A0ABP0CF29_9PEZI
MLSFTLFAASSLVGVATASLSLGSLDLAGFALEKVLDDSSQLFGDYKTALTSKSHLSEWMKSVPDDTQLVHMNIPGTHDAGSWNFTSALMQAVSIDNNVTIEEYLRCQELSMADMLEAGIRFFDLRPALDPTRTYLTIWHDQVESSQLASLEDVMFAFYAWLALHPSETLLVSFEYESGTVSGAAQDLLFEQVLYDMLTSDAAKKYILQTDNTLGTLGESRGKVILVKRFDIQFLSAAQDAEIPGLHLSPNLWTDNGANISFVYNNATDATIYVEDHYDTGVAGDGQSAAANIGIKANASLAHLDLAVHGTAPNSLFITFLSSEHLDAAPYMSPQSMALGFGNSSTPLGGVNQQANAYLKKNKGKRFGIVVADFFNEPSDLISNILDL